MQSFRPLITVRYTVKWGSIEAMDAGPPPGRNLTNGLDQVFTQQVRMVFLRTAVTGPLVRVCNIRTLDRNSLEATPSLFESLRHIRQPFRAPSGTGFEKFGKGFAIVRLPSRVRSNVQLPRSSSSFVFISFTLSEPRPTSKRTRFLPGSAYVIFPMRLVPRSSAR